MKAQNRKIKKPQACPKESDSDESITNQSKTTIKDWTTLAAVS
jgi:hypothetical protein